jgi:hypothetical protein
VTQNELIFKALKGALPLLERLGDFIGNGEVSEAEPLGARCHAILRIKKAIDDLDNDWTHDEKKCPSAGDGPCPGCR